MKKYVFSIETDEGTSIEFIEAEKAEDACDFLDTLFDTDYKIISMYSEEVTTI